MSKYRELVERLATLQGHEYGGAYEGYGHVGHDLQLLVEMADKAEKYDELCNSSDIDLVVEFDELGMSPTTLVPNVKECEDNFRNRILALIKENKELKDFFNTTCKMVGNYTRELDGYISILLLTKRITDEEWKKWIETTKLYVEAIENENKSK